MRPRGKRPSIFDAGGCACGKARRVAFPPGRQRSPRDDMLVETGQVLALLRVAEEEKVRAGRGTRRGSKRGLAVRPPVPCRGRRTISSRFDAETGPRPHCLSGTWAAFCCTTSGSNRVAFICQHPGRREGGAPDRCPARDAPRWDRRQASEVAPTAERYERGSMTITTSQSGAGAGVRRGRDRGRRARPPPPPQPHGSMARASDSSRSARPACSVNR